MSPIPRGGEATAFQVELVPKGVIATRLDMAVRWRRVMNAIPAAVWLSMFPCFVHSGGHWRGTPWFPTF